LIHHPRLIPFLLLPILIALLATAALASSFQGRVVKVLDGDTIEVLRDGKAERVRLHGIDTPEAGQPFGTKAKQFVLELMAQETVTVKVMDTDRYGRTVGEVILPDGTSLNRELVRTGHAWWYRQYSKDTSLGDLESEARASMKGLWSDPNPTPPWEWRAAGRNKGKAPAADSSPKAMSSGPYHGNVSSRVFHQSSCRDYNCKNCTEVMVSRDEAIRKGYRPCGNCKP
jgi:micrococcal nuclease